jgi:hypothetical protein
MAIVTTVHWRSMLSSICRRAIVLATRRRFARLGDDCYRFPYSLTLKANREAGF